MFDLGEHLKIIFRQSNTDKWSQDSSKERPLWCSQTSLVCSPHFESVILIDAFIQVRHKNCTRESYVALKWRGHLSRRVNINETMITSKHGKHYLHYWPFVWGIQRHQWHRASNTELRYFLDVYVKKLLNDQSICRCLETPWCSCDVTLYIFVCRIWLLIKQSCVSHWEIYFFYIQDEDKIKIYYRDDNFYCMALFASSFVDIKHDIRVTPYDRHGVSNQRQLYCFNSLFRLTTEKTSNLRIAVPLKPTGCPRNFFNLGPVTCGLPRQKGQ